MVAGLYILDMANKKRDRNGYKNKLGRYRLNYSELLALEKILWIYADAREMKHAGITEIPEDREHMPRAVVDRYASMGRYRPFHLTFGWNELGIYYPGVNWIYREDSVKLLKERGYPRHTRYIELAAWPGIKVTFTPLSTTVYAQTHYATGLELKVMREVVHQLENYILSSKTSYLNSLSFERM
jgi:hypothetical protein